MDIVNSRVWKGQVPYFARHGFRVITFDARGNGRSERPKRLPTEDLAQDTLSVLDATRVRTTRTGGVVQ